MNGGGNVSFNVDDSNVSPPSEQSLDAINPTVPEMSKSIETVHRVERVQMPQSCPSPRFSFCSISLGDKYYVWGGRNNPHTFDVVENAMHIYDLPTGTWETVEDPSYTTSLTGATPVVWNGKIWTWGGYSTKYHNDMHVFDPKTKRWAEVIQNGDQPQRRWHYSAAVHGDKMYMFGGTFDQTHHMDLHVFKFKTHTWSKVEGQNAPTRPRRRHRQVVWRDRLYIIGGKEDSETASTMLVYDLKTKIWSEIKDSDIDTARGTCIPASHDHSLYLHGDEVYLFGAGKPHRVMKYYFTQKVWMPVVPTDYLASGLWNIPSHHGNPAVWNGSIYFFGGRKTVGSEMANDMYKFVIEEPSNFASLAELLTQPRDFSNVRFRVSGKWIYADRCILWAKSEYFKRFFRGEFKDSIQDTVQINIPNCSYRVFYSLIHYIYTNEKWSPGSWEETLAFLQQANKYQIQPIQQHCCQLLCRMLTLENVDVIWRAGDMYYVQELKEICLDYIVDRYSEFVDAGKYEELLKCGSAASNALIKAIAKRLAEILRERISDRKGKQRYITHI